MMSSRIMTKASRPNHPAQRRKLHRNSKHCEQLLSFSLFQVTSSNHQPLTLFNFTTVSVFVPVYFTLYRLYYVSGKLERIRGQRNQYRFLDVNA
ncbi:unnamed protein product [Schistosoma curassoni]|uniref:Transmembrane protein n=1 Tax=Schistosoma curassoni TaxID=6186 RepID=A0A183KNU2_9TREM|nr:unnamed protein product [Schistosoma curassoni]